MDWIDILNNIVNSLVPYVITAVTGFVAWLGMVIKNKYTQKVTNEEVRNVVDNTVKYVEQKFKEFTSKEKYQLAMEKIVNILESKGIKVSEDEIEMLIESTVLTLTSSVKK